VANSNVASIGTIIIDGWIRIDLYSLRFQANLTMSPAKKNVQFQRTLERLYQWAPLSGGFL